ncbi:MAG TPA: SMR family transporter [Pseudonocardia sp.]|uniref:DMT family transporter n=1 Tax=Pseudonocardia sp. TaxID=60912 RepID=UPI002B4ADB5D|nr:SMR family transporter [Pseudonocardia sp.]HLU57239.1 SMR family transporter [Pseudonocardia sp.]
MATRERAREGSRRVTGWMWLLAAGLVEIAWAQSIPPTKGLTRLWPSVLCIALCAAIIWLLARATAAGVPVSTAYVVFTGMGAAGAVLLGLTVHHDPVTPMRIGALVLITGGVLLAHAAH